MNAQEKKKARNKRYYEKHKEKILAQAKISHEKKVLSPEQKEKHRERSKDYYAKTKDNPDRKAVRKACTKSWYQENKDRILREMKVWRQSMLGTLKYRFKRAIQSAKQRGIAFSLSYERFVDAADQPCYYCNNQLCSQVLEGSGLDRIDSSKSYEVGNVLPCGFRCNKIKMDDLTVEETKAAVEAILKVRHERIRKTNAGSQGQDSPTQG